MNFQKLQSGMLFQFTKADHWIAFVIGLSPPLKATSKLCLWFGSSLKEPFCSYSVPSHRFRWSDSHDYSSNIITDRFDRMPRVFSLTKLTGYSNLWIISEGFQRVWEFDGTASSVGRLLWGTGRMPNVEWWQIRSVARKDLEGRIGGIDASC
jgi:hypothetical protein